MCNQTRMCDNYKIYYLRDNEHNLIFKYLIILKKKYSCEYLPGKKKRGIKTKLNGVFFLNAV